MEDILQLNNQIYISASSSLADQRMRVLKYAEVFGIFDVFGDVKPVGLGTQGIYSGATRYLSRMEMRVGNRYPVYLSSTITNDDMLLTVDLTNPDIVHPNGKTLLHSSFHVFRSKFLYDDGCYEQLEITNFANEASHLPISFLFDSDFADMFQIRGIKREKHGELLATEIKEDQVIFSYRGADNKIRRCRIYFTPTPLEVTKTSCQFVVALAPQEKKKIHISIHCYEGDVPDLPATIYTDLHPKLELNYKKESEQGCEIHSSSERFNAWIRRSKSDILLMTTQYDSGPYPYAGIPWFNTIFGRDGIVTALQYLWVDSSLAKGVLSYLANTQATLNNPYEDAEPGKILHEFRKGEMVDTGEVPFKKYYGSADSTPLFIILAGSYLDVTGDKSFIESIWPNIQQALQWIDKYGDADGDGFVEYNRRSPRGLINQGWKDSKDSVSHSDGMLAEGSIALAEVQAYVYEAKLQAAKIAKYLGDANLSTQLILEAESLKRKFAEAFWSPKIDCIALALDGKKNPCNVLSSNAGQCLFGGILEQDQAEKVAKKMLSREMFSGWGVRTLSSKEVRYNPMSYHNGSVWPHDNSMLVEGFARYGLKAEVLKVTKAIFDVSAEVDLCRLPELFCGFPRRLGQGPTLYPVACSPQAWAAGSVVMLLKACLGLSINAPENRVSFHHPVLPSFITDLKLKHLRIGNAAVDILFRRHGSEVSVYVERRVGKLDVDIMK